MGIFRRVFTEWSWNFHVNFEYLNFGCDRGRTKPLRFEKQSLIHHWALRIAVSSRCFVTFISTPLYNFTTVQKWTMRLFPIICCPDVLAKCCKHVCNVAKIDQILNMISELNLEQLEGRTSQKVDLWKRLDEPTCRSYYVLKSWSTK